MQCFLECPDEFGPGCDEPVWATDGGGIRCALAPYSIAAPELPWSWRNGGCCPLVRIICTQPYNKWEYGAMLTPEERMLLVEQQDRLIDLFVQRKEASGAEDWTRVRELQTEIDDAQGQ